MSQKLEWMYAELCAHSLQTVLVPSKRRMNEWDMIRCNIDVPPRWYRDLCNLHASKRGVRRAKHDTIIRRRETLRCLERMIAGSRTGRYEERVLAILPRVKV